LKKCDGRLHFPEAIIQIIIVKERKAAEAFFLEYRRQFDPNASKGLTAINQRTH